MIKLSDYKNTKNLSSQNIFIKDEQITDENNHRYFLHHIDFLHLFREKNHLLNEEISKKFQELSYYEKPFADKLKDPCFQLVEFIHQDFHSFRILKSSDDIYMAPLGLDYIYAGLHDGSYYLDELTEFLSSRSDISFIIYDHENKSRKELRCPLSVHHYEDKEIGSIIYDIQHHLGENESQPEENEGLSIFFRPSTAQIDKLLEFQKEFNQNKEYRLSYVSRQIYNVEQFVVRDLLGGEEFFKHPPKEELKPIRKFKR